MSDATYYLPKGLPTPVPSEPRLEQPYWDAARDEKILLQRCNACSTWQWGPEWICHHCLSDDMGWAEAPPRGRIYSWERVWHPVHPALREATPYLAVLVELPDAGHVRVVGNLLGDPRQEVTIGAAVEAVFEHHREADTPYTLTQWRMIEE